MDKNQLTDDYLDKIQFWGLFGTVVLLYALSWGFVWLDRKMPTYTFRIVDPRAAVAPALEASSPDRPALEGPAPDRPALERPALEASAPETR